MIDKFRVIRGERILEALIAAQDPVLLELTYNELDRKTRTEMPPTTKRENIVSGVNINNLQMIPFQQSNSLKIEATATGGDHPYYPVMLFSDIVFEPEDTANNVTFTGADGKEYNIKPLVLSKANVKLKCTCLDFYWRFANWDANNNALYGDKPSLYIKKTNRPPVNPRRTPGICKHLMKLSSVLIASRLFRR